MEKKKKASAERTEPFSGEAFAEKGTGGSADLRQAVEQEAKSEPALTAKGSAGAGVVEHPAELSGEHHGRKEKGKKPEPQREQIESDWGRFQAETRNVRSGKKRRNRWVKIRGRMDLQTGRMITEEELRLRKELEEAQKKNKEAAAQLETESQAHKKKKKKKKKIREESAVEPPVAAEITEEDLKKRKKRKGKHTDVNEAEVEMAFQRTMASIEDAGESERAALRRKKRKEKFEAAQREIEKQEIAKRKLKLPEFVSVGELAKLMSVDVAEVISKCIASGLMVSINQRLDLETITLLADDFGYEVELQEAYSDEVLEDSGNAPRH